MRRLPALLSFALLTSLSLAQIKVNVNGQPVDFIGTGPQKIDGRIMVPLRGVMEKIGAEVKWEGATRTVSATRGSSTLQMRLGERTAVVNGNLVTLDVPAQQINGVTMVPLRFMGEALGADVKWDGTTQTINMTVGGTGTGTGMGTGTGTGTGTETSVAITNFAVVRPEWVKPGDVLQFSLTGTPGGTASVSVGGVSAAINLIEGPAGTYKGSWTAPASGVVLQGTSAIASLRVGTTEKLIQAGTTINIDTESPTFRAVTPENGAKVTIAQPDISGIFEDIGAGIDRTSVVILVNGQNVTGKSTVTDNFFLFRPATNLPNGAATLEVQVRDKAGNARTYRSSFQVDAGGGTAAVKSFQHTARYYAQVGKPIGFKIEAEPGAKVTVSAGAAIQNLALKESPAGVYSGSYVVKATDKFENTLVTAKIALKSGATLEIEAPNRIPKMLEAAAAFGPATITSIADGATAPNPIVLAGKAMPNTKVQIKITYATNVLGALRVTGSITEATVDVDAKGVWKSDSISMSLPVKGSGTEYTVTVTAVNSDGTKAAPTTIKLKG